MLPKSSSAAVHDAFAKNLSYEMLMGFLAAKEFHASADQSEDNAEQIFTRYAIVLNTVQSLGVDLKSKPSDLPEEEANRIAGIMAQMKPKPSLPPQPITKETPIAAGLAGHPGKMAFDDPWG
jgi:hypothetical protein